MESDDLTWQRAREQRARWDASASNYEKWWPVSQRAAQHISDRLVALARITPRLRVLDVATGLGEPAATAARAVGPDGFVLGVDLSYQMLAAARRRIASIGIANLALCVMAAATLGVTDHSFDAALCRWGLMFVTDLDAALMEIRRVLRQGGRFATAVWASADKAPMDVLWGRMGKLAGVPAPPRDAFDPWRLANTDILTTALSRAGFHELQIERVVAKYEFESPAAFRDTCIASSSALREALDAQPPEVRLRIADEISDLTREYVVPDGRVEIRNEAILFAASA